MEDSWHPRINSVSYGETNEKCIKKEVAKVDQMIENEMEAKSSNNVHERLTEDSWHPRIKSVNYGEHKEKCIKKEVAQVDQLIESEMEATSSDDVPEKLAEDSWHPKISQSIMVRPIKNASKKKLPR